MANLSGNCIYIVQIGLMSCMSWVLFLRGCDYERGEGGGERERMELMSKAYKRGELYVICIVSK